MALRPEDYVTAMQLRGGKLPLWNESHVIDAFDSLSFSELLELYPFMLGDEHGAELNPLFLPLFKKSFAALSSSDAVALKGSIYSRKAIHAICAEDYFSRPDLSLDEIHAFYWLDADLQLSYLRKYLGSYSCEELRAVMVRFDRSKEAYFSGYSHPSDSPYLVAKECLYYLDDSTLLEKFDAHSSRNVVFATEARDFVLHIPEARDEDLWAFLGKYFQTSLLFDLTEVEGLSLKTDQLNKFTEMRAAMHEIEHRKAFSFQDMEHFLKNSIGCGMYSYYNPFLLLSTSLVSALSELDLSPLLTVYCRHARAAHVAVKGVWKKPDIISRGKKEPYSVEYYVDDVLSDTSIPFSDMHKLLSVSPHTDFGLLQIKNAFLDLSLEDQLSYVIPTERYNYLLGDHQLTRYLREVLYESYAQ